MPLWVQYSLVVSGIIFGVSLAARLAYQQWAAWLAFFVVGIATAGVASGYLDTGKIVGAMALGAAIGFLAPEIWDAAYAQARKPRTWLYVGAVVVGLAAVWDSQVLGALLAVGIMVAGFRWLFRKTFRR